MLESEYFTFRELMKTEGSELSASMEDYLEMIYRLSYKPGYTRVGELAAALNVQPPSVSNMLQKLTELNLIDYRKYGIVRMTRKGQKIGKSLIFRHNTIEKFLKIIGVSEGLLEETEKIEHTINVLTLKHLSNLVDFFELNPDILNKFESFRVENKNKRLGQ
jgi:Mn-dependent DtxR family transcriptional regulator